MFFYVIKIKRIRKIIKISVIILLVLFTVPATAVLFLQNNKIQSQLTHFLTEKLGKELDTYISINDVSVTFINRFLIRDFYVEDQFGDTLLYAKKVKLIFSKFNKSKNIAIVKRLDFTEADIHISKDSTGVNNLKFIIEALKNPEKKANGEKLNLSFESIRFQNSVISLKTPEKRKSKADINLNDLKLLNFNAQLINLHFSGDTVNFMLRNLNFIESSGLKVKNMKAGLSISRRHFNYSNVFLETTHSEISASNMSMKFSDLTDFQNFTEKIYLHLNLRSSYIGLQDLGYFSPVFKNINERILITGFISGTINDLSGEKILLASKNFSGFKGGFNIIGLPNFDETFMHFDIDHFQTHLNDIENIQFQNDYYIAVPERFEELGEIKYSGKFTGYLDDFVAYGMLETDIGKVSTDIQITPSPTGGLSFEGKVKTRSLSIGQLIKENNLLGNLSMSAMVDGSIEKGNISANMIGNIDSLDFYNYIYKDIHISGYLSNRIFDGSFNVADPNIKLDFKGKVDFADEIPVFDFTADVMRVRPYYLNINKSDPSYFASFLLTSNFSGIDPDNINGEIKLINSFFQRSDEQLQIYDFSIQAKNSPDSSALIIRSDIFDADIFGKYRISTLKQSFIDLTRHYLPSISSDSINITRVDLNKFEYDIRLKSTNRVIQFFTRDFEIGNNSVISGNYDAQSFSTHFNANFPMAGIQDKKWENIQMHAISDSFNSSFIALVDNFHINDELSLENIELKSIVANDNLSFKLNWRNSDTVKYIGNIDMLASLSNNDQSNNLIFDIELFPSYIIFSDTVWNMPNSSFHIDSTSIRIDSFSLNNKNQRFLLNGAITENKQDRLDLLVENFQISTLNNFSKSENIYFKGITTGIASLSSAYSQPMITTDLSINSLEINNENLGDALLQASWDNLSKSIRILASSIKGNSKILHLQGFYNPLNEDIDFDINFDKIRLSAFEPFTKKLVSDVKGLASGSLILKGKMKKPVLNGEINFFKTSFMVNYLKTRYSLSDKVQISNNNILFDNMELRDELANEGKLNGIITSRNLKDFNLNLNFETENFSFLNTNEFDNQIFYGKVFAGGIINFSGPPKNLFIDINARSEKNSVFYIPLYGAEEVNVSDFIQFVNSSDIKKEIDDVNGNYEVKMQGLTMDFKLEVTPDAEVQLIFDPKVGDILRGRGNGNLNLSISTLGKFEIYGDMIIDEGDYLFTLQNVINKRFKVKRGGSIIWNGDPADATIDLQAIYSLSTSVYELSPEPQEELKKRIPVECHILMTDKLMRPTIKTDIILPTADQETRNIVSNSINTEEESTKQFLSLLIINSFYSDASDRLTGDYNAANVAGTAASELFSNQLSNWLSQISNDFDLGLNYRRGDEITPNELEVALSTQILNDRVTINGNLDVGADQARQTSEITNTNNIVGDFDIDFKLTDNGKVHVKAFNRANDNLLFQTSPYTQGVGIFYREDFNSFEDLMQRYKDAIRRLFTKKEDAIAEEDVKG